jgi:hypothetical protein
MLLTAACGCHIRLLFHSFGMLNLCLGQWEHALKQLSDTCLAPDACLFEKRWLGDVRQALQQIVAHLLCVFLLCPVIPSAYGR